MDALDTVGVIEMNRHTKWLRLVAQALGGGTAISILMLMLAHMGIYEYGYEWEWLEKAAPHLGLTLALGLSLMLALSMMTGWVLKCRWLKALGRTAKAFAVGMPLGIIFVGMGMMGFLLEFAFMVLEG